MIIAQVVLVGGVLAVLGAALFGIIFSTSGEFVLATIDCNVTENPDGASDCNADNKVVDSNGDLCQTGNLGLFTSAFTPECAAGTEYEVPSIVLPYDGDPLNFGPLFAAQTNLAGAIPLLTNGAEIEFTTCEAFFDESLLVTAVLSAANAGISGGVDAFAEQVKLGYDAGIEGFVTDLDNSLYAGVPDAFIGGFNTAAGNFALPDLPTLLSDTYDTSTSALAVDCPTGTVSAIIGCVATFFEGFNVTIGTSVDNLITLGLAANPMGDNIRDLLALAVGFEANATSPFAAPIFAAQVTALPAEGMWSPFNSFVLCNKFAGCTTHREYLQGTFESLNDNSDPTGELRAQLGLLVNALDGYALGALAFVAATSTMPALENSTDLDGDFTLLVVAATSSASSVTLSSGLDASALQIQQVYNGFLTKAALISRLQSGLAASFLTPPDFLLPAFNQTIVDPPTVFDSLQGWGLLCAVQGLPQSCSYYEFVGDLLANTNPVTDPGTHQDLSLIFGVLSSCRFILMTTDITTCVANNAAAGVPLDVATGPSLVDVTTESVLGAFYPLTTEASDGQAAMFDEAVTLCEDDEKDRAAIAAAQQLVPAGIALLGISSILAVVNLVKVQNKILGVVAGLFGLLGAGLALAGLLGVYNAPIYASVGASDGPVEDNSFVYSSGVALTYALVLIGGGFVGGLAVLVGGAMLPGKDESSEILGKA